MAAMPDYTLNTMGIDLSGMPTGDYSGDPLGAAAAGVPAPSVDPYAMPGDAGEAQALDPYNPAPAQQQGAPWWAGYAAYGFNRAIDNLLPRSPTGIMGNTSPGTIAGAGNRSYTVKPQAAGGGVKLSAQTPLGFAKITGSPTLMLAAGAVLFLLLKK